VKNEVAVTMIVVALLVGAATVYVWEGSNPSLSRSSSEATRTVTTTMQSTGPEVMLMTFNGTQYYADDVSNDFALQNPGYSYILNGSITFMGVRFETNCPSVYAGCPEPPGSTKAQTIVYAGVISFNMTWQQDKSSETAGGMIGDSTYVYFLSKRTGPSAGILIENVPSAKAFLLVQYLP
jgi:hypothetical protein